jgi:hypothetical protein
MAGIPVLRLLMMTIALGAVAGCVEPFGGSNVQFDFHEPVPAAARPGVTPVANQPPANTHLVLYGTDFKYQLDADGVPVLNAGGDKIVEAAYVFKIKEFEIRPVIDPTSPCFIDLEDTRFPGVHVTRYAERLKVDTGISDPFADGQDPGDVIDVLTALRRMELLPAFVANLKTVTSYASFTYPAVGTACGGDPNLIPPPQCDSDADNAVRLRLCRAAWAQAGPNFYEGSDKVFSLPLNGQYFGMVEGTNPINGGPVGGASMYVDTNLAEMDAFLVNWDYNDPAADPNGANRSPTGYHLLAGEPKRFARGVINSEMLNRNDGRIAADLTIFPDLSSDDVHF